MRTLIIIVNYNNKIDTMECLEGLRRLEGDFDVFVSDNASRDGSLDDLQKWAEGTLPAKTDGAVWDTIRDRPLTIKHVTWGRYENEDAAREDPTARWVTFVPTGGSRGFAVGNNVGLRYGLTRDYDYFWILNNDTVPDPSALNHLVTQMKNDPSIGICGSTVVYYALPSKVQTWGGCRYMRHRAQSVGIGLGQPFPPLPHPQTVEKEIDYINGASMFVSRQFIEKIGLMSEDYYLYFEEMDWAIRMRGHFRQAYQALSVIYHKHGGTVGGGSKLPSHDSIYYMTINRILFTRRYFRIQLPIVVTAVIFQVLKYMLKKHWKIAFYTFKYLIYGLFMAQYPLRTLH